MVWTRAQRQVYKWDRPLAAVNSMCDQLLGDMWELSFPGLYAFPDLADKLLQLQGFPSLPHHMSVQRSEATPNKIPVIVAFGPGAS